MEPVPFAIACPPLYTNTSPSPFGNNRLPYLLLFQQSPSPFGNNRLPYLLLFQPHVRSFTHSVALAFPAWLCSIEHMRRRFATLRIRSHCSGSRSLCSGLRKVPLSGIRPIAHSLSALELAQVSLQLALLVVSTVASPPHFGIIGGRGHLFTHSDIASSRSSSAACAFNACRDAERVRLPFTIFLHLQCVWVAG